MLWTVQSSCSRTQCHFCKRINSFLRINTSMFHPENMTLSSQPESYLHSDVAKVLQPTRNDVAKIPLATRLMIHTHVNLSVMLQKTTILQDRICINL